MNSDNASNDNDDDNSHNDNINTTHKQHRRITTLRSTNDNKQAHPQDFASPPPRYHQHQTTINMIIQNYQQRQTQQTK